MKNYKHAKTCCITGHRVIADAKFNRVIDRLRDEALQAIDEGYTHFISGFAEGIDLIFASIIAECKQREKNITLEAAIPYSKRLNTNDKGFQKLIIQCDIVNVVCERYDSGCFHSRNRFLIDHADYLLAVYDDNDTGGTAYTVKYGKQKSRHLIIIHPDILAVTNM